MKETDSLNATVFSRVKAGVSQLAARQSLVTIDEDKVDAFVREELHKGSTIEDATKAAKSAGMPLKVCLQRVWRRASSVSFGWKVPCARPIAP